MPQQPKRDQPKAGGNYRLYHPDGDSVGQFLPGLSLGQHERESGGGEHATDAGRARSAEHTSHGAEPPFQHPAQRG